LEGLWIRHSEQYRQYVTAAADSHLRFRQRFGSNIRDIDLCSRQRTNLSWITRAKKIVR
jgi:hypothetical protein